MAGSFTMKIFSPRSLTILSLVLLVNKSFSQSGNYKSDSMDMTRIPIKTMKIDESDLPGATRVNFRFVRVEDVRFDTTQVGIYSTFDASLWGYPGVNNYKIDLDGGLTHGFSYYLNHSLTPMHPNEPGEVVCFIKRLSMIRRDTLLDYPAMAKRYGTMTFEAEVLLHSGNNYYAAFKIDTVFRALIDVGKRQFLEDLKTHLLLPALKLLKEKIGTTDWASVDNRKAFAENFVNGHYFSNRFKIPALTTPPKKGIYRTFAEFRNNTPSVTDFTVRKEKFKTVLIEDAKGDLIATTRLFGFCDGTTRWILLGNYGFPLLRVANSFEFFITAAKKVKVLLAVDMESGKIY